MLNITNVCEDTKKAAFEMIYRLPANISKLQPFGTRCYFYNKNIRDKWSVRGIEAVLVGYGERMDSFRIWQPGTSKVIVKKDPIFVDTPRNRFDRLDQSAGPATHTDSESLGEQTLSPVGELESQEPPSREEANDLQDGDQDTRVRNF